MCYVDKTRRHLQARIKEPLRGGPVKTHLETRIDGITQDSVDILGYTSKGEIHLLTLQTLWFRELKPEYTRCNEKQRLEIDNQVLVNCYDKYLLFEATINILYFFLLYSQIF